MHFDSIQVLRGLAALFVVAEHIRFLACGAFGVDIFFCISGFMIMFTTHKSTAFFFRKRLFRIVPFYWIMTLFTFLLLLLFPSMFASTQASLPALLKSLFFIPFHVGGGILQPILRIGWTINCEMFFYLLFWISYHISHKYRGLICSSMLLVLTAIGTRISFQMSLSIAPSWYDNKILRSIFSSAPFRFFSDTIMLEFALGILCYYIAGYLYNKISSLSSSKAFCAFISTFSLILGIFILAVLALSTKNVNILGYRRFFIWGIPSMVILLCFFTAGLTLHMPRLLTRLGDISFSVYLVHYYPVMFLDRMVFDFSSLRLTSAVGAVIGFAIALVCGYAAWYLIEHKLTGYLRKHFLPPS